MRAYVYQAALLCNDCGIDVKHRIGTRPADATSDNWPDGPHLDGGGEADGPQCCDHCGTFLENPLTRDGTKIVKSMLRTHRIEGTGNVDFLETIADFYHGCGRAARDVLRKVRLEAETGRVFTLKLWDSGLEDRDGRTVLGYELTGPHPIDGTGPIVLFRGEDFRPSLCNAIDGDESVRALIGFLTLRPGDTDAEYFDGYTDLQRAFCDRDAESLSLYAIEPGETDGDVLELEDEDGDE